MTTEFDKSTPHWRGCDYRENDGHLCIERDGLTMLLLHRTKALTDDEFRSLVNDIVARLNGSGQGDAVAWQDIATAPKERRSILVRCEERKNTYIVTWGQIEDERGGWMHFCSGHPALTEKPTLWMPLPPAPDTARPPAASARISDLEMALSKLEKAATEIARYGASTGHQWLLLGVEISKARAALAPAERAEAAPDDELLAEGIAALRVLLASENDRTRMRRIISSIFDPDPAPTRAGALDAAGEHWRQIAEGLGAALEEIRDSHLPDQPASDGGDEYDWAVRHISTLRRKAKAALAAGDGGEDA